MSVNTGWLISEICHAKNAPSTIKNTPRPPSTVSQVCEEHCRTADYDYFALEFGFMCSCGNRLPKQELVAEDSECSTASLPISIVRISEVFLGFVGALLSCGYHHARVDPVQMIFIDTSGPTVVPCCLLVLSCLPAIKLTCLSFMSVS